MLTVVRDGVGYRDFWVISTKLVLLLGGSGAARHGKQERRDFRDQEEEKKKKALRKVTVVMDCIRESLTWAPALTRGEKTHLTL